MNSPSTGSLSDSLLLEQCALVEQRLRDSFCQRIHSFHIQVLDDGLVLEGRANTYYAKQVVQQAVMEVTDHPIRANNIVVG